MTLPLAEVIGHPLWITSADGLVTVDQTGRMVAANPSFVELFGYPLDELVGESVDVLVPTEVRGHHSSHRSSFESAPQARPMGASRLLHGLRRDGTTFPINVSLSRIDTTDGPHTIAAVRDLTVWVHAEAEASSAHRRRMIAEDHDRIANELHDTVIQKLFALGLRLQGLPARMTSPEAIPVVDDAVDIIDGVIAEIRTTIHGLRVEPAADERLRRRVLAVIDEMEEALGSASVRLTFDGQVDRIVDAAVVENLLPTLREALANAARHARADAIEISIGYDESARTVTLIVSDDGVGVGQTTRRSGLANLDARATALGGSLQIEPAAPNGTVLRWSVPAPTR